MKHKYDMAYKDGNRLIYDFEKVACDPGQVDGLDPLVADAIPWELEKEGIMEILDVMFDGESAKSLFPCWMSLNVLRPWVHPAEYIMRLILSHLHGPLLLLLLW